MIIRKILIISSEKIVVNVLSVNSIGVVMFVVILKIFNGKVL